MSGPKKLTLDKVLWLQECRHILYGKEDKLLELSFAMYDSALDGMITSNEVADLVMSLPLYTKIYNEAMCMAEIIIQENYNSYTSAKIFVEPKVFNKVVGISLIIRELQDSLLANSIRSSSAFDTERQELVCHDESITEKMKALVNKSNPDV